MNLSILDWIGLVSGVMGIIGIPSLVSLIKWIKIERTISEKGKKNFTKEKFQIQNSINFNGSYKEISLPSKSILKKTVYDESDNNLMIKIVISLLVFPIFLFTTYDFSVTFLFTLSSVLIVIVFTVGQEKIDNIIKNKRESYYKFHANEIIPFQLYGRAKNLIKINGKWGLYSYSYKEILPPVFDKIDKHFSVSIDEDKFSFLKYVDYFKVMKDGKWGVIDIYRKILLPIKYDGIRKINFAEKYIDAEKGIEVFRVSTHGIKRLSYTIDYSFTKEY